MSNSEKPNALTIPTSKSSATKKKWKKFDLSSADTSEYKWLTLDSAFVAASQAPFRIGIGPRAGTHVICYFNPASGEYDDCKVVPD